jgi:hypothetical protein
MRVTAHGMYGYALLGSATHAEARDFANRYLRVVGPLCDAKYSYDGATVVCSFEPLLWPNPTDDAHRFAAEFALSAHLTTMKDLAAESFGFSQVALSYAKPAHACIYEGFFECPVLFKQRNNQYRCELARADGTIALADSRTHGMAREMCEQILSEINRARGLAADIRRMLLDRPGRYRNIEAAAEKLSMHPRAPRQRRETEETSYRKLLAEVRARLAIDYLRKTNMTNEEIVSRLPVRISSIRDPLIRNIKTNHQR